MDISSGVTGVVILGGAFWAAGKFGPGLVASRIDAAFDAIKDSAWIRDPAKPKRAMALLAIAQLLEEEIPNPGQGQEVYDALGVQAAALVHVGSAAQWSKVLRQFGDAIDLEIADDIKKIV